MSYILQYLESQIKKIVQLNPIDMLPTLTLKRDGKSNSTLPALAQPQFGVPTPEA